MKSSIDNNVYQALETDIKIGELKIEHKFNFLTYPWNHLLINQYRESHSSKAKKTVKKQINRQKTETNTQ